MKKIVVSAVLFSYGCSFMSVNELKLHTADKIPDCTTSTLAPGFDVVLAENGVVTALVGAAVLDTDRSNGAALAIAGGIQLGLGIASAVYGFKHTRQCRQAIAIAAGDGRDPQETMGANHWKYPVAVYNIVLVVAALAEAAKKNKGNTIEIKFEGDSCAAPTAQCEDGWYSCSEHRNGTCSQHRGVKEWLREPLF